MEPEGSLPCSQGPDTGPRCIQCTPSHSISLRSVLILSSHLRLGLPTGLFPSGFPTKILYAILTSPMQSTRPSHPRWFDHPNNIWWNIQVMKPPSSKSPLATCHFLPLRPKVPIMLYNTYWKVNVKLQIVTWFLL